MRRLDRSPTGARLFVIVRWMALLGLCACAAACQPSNEPVVVHVALKVRHYRLANGLEVVLEEDHHAPEVAIDVRYHVGSKDDPPGRSGLAHLVEHVNFAATRHVPKDGVLPLLRTIGARDYNGATAEEYTHYYAVAPSNELATLMWIESDQMGFVDVEDKFVDRERLIVEQERRENHDTVLGNLWTFVDQAVYPDSHPYHRPGIGTEADIAALTLEDIKAFRQRYYSPDNATLVLVGDFDSARAEALLERYFGSLAPHGTQSSAAVPPVRRAALKHMRVEADTQRAVVAVAWPMPAPTADGYLEARAALAFISGEVSHHLVGTTHLAVAAWGDFRAARGGTVGAVIVEFEGNKPREDDVLDDVAYTRRNYTDLSHAVGTLKTNLIVSTISGLEGLESRAEVIQNVLEWYGVADASQALLERISQLQGETVVDALSTFFDPSDAAVIVVVPTKGAPRGGRVVP